MPNYSCLYLPCRYRRYTTADITILTTIIISQDTRKQHIRQEKLLYR